MYYYVYMYMYTILIRIEARASIFYKINDFEPAFKRVWRLFDPQH